MSESPESTRPASVHLPALSPALYCSERFAGHRSTFSPLLPSRIRAALASRACLARPTPPPLPLRPPECGCPPLRQPPVLALSSQLPRVRLSYQQSESGRERFGFASYHDRQTGNARPATAV